MRIHYKIPKTDRKAFNSAWDEYDRPEERRGNATREETTHKVAWSTVKKEYEINERTGKWIKKKE